MGINRMIRGAENERLLMHCHSRAELFWRCNLIFQSVSRLDSMIPRVN